MAQITALDIAIMSQDVGIFFLNHTYALGVHSYTLIAPSGMTVDKFNTPATTTRMAQLSCMISGDIDGDGLDDLIVGTMRNPSGETHQRHHVLQPHVQGSDIRRGQRQRLTDRMAAVSGRRPRHADTLLGPDAMITVPRP